MESGSLYSEALASQRARIKHPSRVKQRITQQSRGLRTMPAFDTATYGRHPSEQLDERIDLKSSIEVEASELVVTRPECVLLGVRPFRGARVGSGVAHRWMGNPTWLTRVCNRESLRRLAIRGSAWKCQDSYEGTRDSQNGHGGRPFVHGFSVFSQSKTAI